MTAAALDVVTINLWGGNGPARERMEDLGAWLGEEQPDLVLLQEVEAVDGRDQAQLLAEEAGYAHRAGVRTGIGPVPGEGLAILSRHPLEPREPIRLPLAALDHPRSLQQVDADTPLGPVRVATTHLSWRLGAGAARARQARAAVDALADSGSPVVLGGDLNDVPGSPALTALAEAGFADCCDHAAEPRPTFDAENPHMWQDDLAGRRVDHLLARGLEPAQARVVLDGRDGPVVSDHYGVRALLHRPDAGA